MALVAALAIVLPQWPWTAALFGFSALPPALWAALLGLVCAYAVSTEIAKRVFFSRRRARARLSAPSGSAASSS